MAKKEKEKLLNKVFNIDSRLILETITSNTKVKSTITYPPYFDMKDYGSNNQVGYGQKYDEYLDEKLDNILSASNRPLLESTGTVSHKQAIEKATHEFEVYRQKEMLQYESDFDRAIKELKAQTNSDKNE